MLWFYHFLPHHLSYLLPQKIIHYLPSGQSDRIHYVVDSILVILWTAF